MIWNVGDDDIEDDTELRLSIPDYFPRDDDHNNVETHLTMQQSTNQSSVLAHVTTDQPIRGEYESVDSSPPPHDHWLSLSPVITSNI